MIATAQTRKLKVLVIDDQLTELFLDPKQGFSSYLDIASIRSWADAQSLVASDGELEGADIVLIDVSLEKDTGISKARGADHSLLPVGPLLALPFIAKRSIMACVIYSGHLLSDRLHKHPLFLLAMGLILARTEGLAPGVALHSSHLSDGSGKKMLDEEIQRLAKDGPSDPPAALDKALGEYRERLEMMVNNQIVSIANRQQCLGRISQISHECARRETILLGDGLYLTLVGQNWKDAIDLRSLFADRLNWATEYATVEWLSEVKLWIESLGQSPVECAIEVIKSQDEIEDNKLEELNNKKTGNKKMEKKELGGKVIKSRRPLASEILLQKFKKTLSQDDLTEMLRLVVLFANVWAADNAPEGNRVAKQSIYRRLGHSVDQNIYFNMFGERGAKADTKGHFKRLRPLSDGEDKISKCFLGKNSVISEEDYRAIQQYRSAEGFPEWRTPPYKISPASGRI